MRVVVVGAGIIGSSVAYEAAKAGAQVTVLEAGKIAGGASGTSFAWTNATGKRPHAYFALNVAGMRAHLDLSREFGNAPWFKQTGSLEWYSKPEDWAAQKDNADQMKEWGYGVEWISKTRVKELEPEIDLSAIGDSPIVYYPEEGWVDPVLYSAWLLRAAKEKWGLEVHTFDGATSVDVRDGVATAVRTTDGKVYEADAIINCTGSWADRILDGVPAVPMKSNVGVLGFTFPVAATLQRQFHMDDLDVRPDGAGRLMIHKISVDSLVPALKQLDPKGDEAALLLEAVGKVIPALQGQNLESIRTTMRPIPGDNLTCSGWVPGISGYYVAVTHSGVTIAPYLGKAVADEVVRGNLHESLLDFRPDRFLAAKKWHGTEIMTIQHIGKTERLSRVVVHEKIAYFSGLTADDRQQDTHGQTAQILAKADTFLRTIGSNRSLILSATIWLRDIEDFDQMNVAWVDWIEKDAPPARATVQAVMGLPDILVEIQFTVAIPA